MEKQELGKLTQLDPRTVWKNEAHHFTPWLASDANISLLGTELGIELEVEDTEVAAGPFSADILAKDTSTDRYVVIENQLGKTDHDHLGKCITYASVLSATAIVWIAAEFTEEHKKALDWLNENVSEDLSFYGVKLELWQIENSKMAPRFNVLCKPASSIKESSKLYAKGVLTETRARQLKFWQTFREALGKSKAFPSLQTPQPRYWYNLPLGNSKIHLSSIADTTGNRIGIRVIIKGSVAAAAMPFLLESRAAVEKVVGEPLLWNPNPDNVQKHISLYLADADLSQEAAWDKYITWLVDRTIKFRKAFEPLVKGKKFAVNGTDADSEPEDPEG